MLLVQGHGTTTYAPRLLPDTVEVPVDRRHTALGSNGKLFLEVLPVPLWAFLLVSGQCCLGSLIVNSLTRLFLVARCAVMQSVAGLFRGLPLSVHELEMTKTVGGRDFLWYAPSVRADQLNRSRYLYGIGIVGVSHRGVVLEQLCLG